jgi:hypothetical protein
MCGYDPDLKIKKRWVIEVEASAPSQNQLGGNHRNGHKYRKIKRELDALLGPELRRIAKAKAWRRGIITRCYGKRKRRYDHANLVGGCKALIDLLTAHGVIVDDNEKFWQGHYLQEKSADGIDRIRIVIESP